jgi:hypothetical protein
MWWQMMSVAKLVVPKIASTLRVLKTPSLAGHSSHPFQRI